MCPATLRRRSVCGTTTVPPVSNGRGGPGRLRPLAPVRVTTTPRDQVNTSGWFLTPSLRRPCIHAIFFSTACRTACKHTFCFLRVRPEAMSTRHSRLWQTLDDVYTRRCFSESEGTRFGAPGQKALPSGNEWMEWNEWMDFCLIPLSTTGLIIHCLWCLSGMPSVRPGAGW